MFHVKHFLYSFFKETFMVKQNSNNGTTLRTRIVRDKTKYNRKQKHKKSFAEAGDFSFIKTSLLFFTLIISPFPQMLVPLFPRSIVYNSLYFLYYWNDSWLILQQRHSNLSTSFTMRSRKLFFYRKVFLQMFHVKHYLK